MIAMRGPTETRDLADRVLEDEELSFAVGVVDDAINKLARDPEMTESRAKKLLLPLYRPVLARLWKLRTEYIAAGGDWKAEAMESYRLSQLRPTNEKL